MKKGKKDICLILITIYILIQPIIDVMTSICVRYINNTITVGIIVRIVFLIAIAIYAIISAKPKEKIEILIYYAIISIYCIAFLLNIRANYETKIAIMQVKYLLKTFFQPVVLVALLVILKNKQINNKYIIHTLLGYVFIIIITYIMGIGFDSYADGSAFGKNGLFYAANEIGTIICILLPYLAMALLDKNTLNNDKINYYIYIFTLICSIFAALTMGTKVPFIGMIAILLVSVCVCIINIIKRKDVKQYTYQAVIGIIIMVFMFSILGYTPVGKNLQVLTSKISKFFGINNTVEIGNTENWNNSVISNNTTTDNTSIVNTATNNTVEIDNTKNDSLSNIVTSNRQQFLEINGEIYKKAKITDKLLGMGYTEVNDGEVKERKLVEIDYYDILYSNGMIGLSIQFLPLVISTIYILVNLLKNINMLFKNETIFRLYMVLITLLVAKLSGHVFCAPSVSFYLSLEISQFILFLKQSEKLNG